MSSSRLQAETKLSAEYLGLFSVEWAKWKAISIYTWLLLLKKSKPFRSFTVVRSKSRGVLCSLVLHTSKFSEIEISKFVPWILTCVKSAAWGSAAGQTVTQFFCTHTALCFPETRSSITIQSFRCLFRRKPLNFITCYLGYERDSCSVNYGATQSDLKAFLKIKCQKLRNSMREKGNLGGSSFLHL